MSTQILLITHDHIGTSLLSAAKKTFGTLPMPIKIVAVNYHHNPEDIIIKLEPLTNSNQSMLILTDMYGSTPCNIALALHKHKNIRVISGLNLPMLIKILNYSDLSLEELTEKAIQGGKEGVVNCTYENENQ